MNEQLIQSFNGTLNQLIMSVKECYPEQLVDVVDLNEQKHFDFFLKQVEDKKSLLLSQSDTLFENCFIVCEGFDLSPIFEIATPKNKETIWKFLSALVLISTSGELEEKNEFDLIETLISADDKTSTAAPEFNDDIEETLDECKKLFDNTKIGKLATEIAEDVKMEDFGDIGDMKSPNIPDLLKSLSSNKGLQSMIEKIKSKVTSTLDTEDNPDNLAHEVKDIMNKMKSNKKIQKILKSKNMQDMLKKTMGGMPNVPPEMMSEMSNFFENNSKQEDFGNLETMFTKNKKTTSTRDRLRKKLEQRKMMNALQSKDSPV